MRDDLSSLSENWHFVNDIKISDMIAIIETKNNAELCFHRLGHMNKK